MEYSWNLADYNMIYVNYMCTGAKAHFGYFEMCRKISKLLPNTFYNLLSMKFYNLLSMK